MQKDKVEQPSEGLDKGLKVFNSLCADKGNVKFIPFKGNRVTWYICGPTTYDHSHLGHARTYITFDIIRRILQDYLGYEVFSVMNITDVDDKIILKARKNYLLKQYIEHNPVLTAKVKEYVEESWESFFVAWQKKISQVMEDENKQNTGLPRRQRGGEKEAELNLLKTRVTEYKLDWLKVEKLMNQHNNDSVEEIFRISKEALCEKLDSDFGYTVEDHNIYRKLAAEFEQEYLEDMKDLNVLMPDVLTRVTEFIPEVIMYVQKILDNGFGYLANGSVYFDTQKFAQLGEHNYGKLEPWSIGLDNLLAEGDGALTNSSGEKKLETDFVVWKKSKAGEPSWDSPWGKGRPGWHIECSAMASSLIGSTIDIHCGGIDLKFPHHDNELAQSEAYFHDEGCKQWVNYFLHSGHLHIDGLKMSKSLKNFITIREARKKYSSTQIRLFFAMRPWNQEISFTEESMIEVQKKEKTFQVFFSLVGQSIRKEKFMSEVSQKWDDLARALYIDFTDVQVGVDVSIKDNFNTPSVISQLLHISEKTIAYIKTLGPSNAQSLLLTKISRFVTRILSIIGIITDRPLGFSVDSDDDFQYDILLDIISNYRAMVRKLAKQNKSELALYESTNKQVEESLGRRLSIFFVTIEEEEIFQSTKHIHNSLFVLLNLILKFRKNLKTILNSQDDINMSQSILYMCDSLRDDDLVPLGVQLEDDSDIRWIKVSAVELIRQRDCKKLKSLEERLKKVKADLKFIQDFKSPPSFKIFPDFNKYESFDQDYLPTHFLDGKQVTEKQRTKLNSILLKYSKNHEIVKAKLAKNSNLEESLIREQKQLSSALETLIKSI